MLRKGAATGERMHGPLEYRLRKADGSFDTTPSPQLRLEVGDIIIGVGKIAELLALEELFTPVAGRREKQ